jgi:hypothetical protein
VKELSLREMNALFYQDPAFQKIILDHAIFFHPCEECAGKLARCHAVIAEEEFRKEIRNYLAAGLEKAMAFSPLII